VSLRAVDGTDVAAIARLGGGGGHRAAAGFSTASSPDDLFAWLERQLPAQMDE
jgi:phosphoesterase RecJ-like protein